MTFQGIDPLILALFVGALALMPMLLIICTSFLKIVIVLMIKLTKVISNVQEVSENVSKATEWLSPAKVFGELSHFFRSFKK